jgi:hypothetical protein
MPKPFTPLTLLQFRDMLMRFPFSRVVSVVHMHHTWRPNRAQYKGLASIDAMHEFHTKERGFSDIAQHITIAPDGTIWTGRNWNKAPASATGHNGSSLSGPFMFEMIGDFDTGQDSFDDPQRTTVLEVVAAVQKRFGLPPDALRFHRQMADKSCPGSGIDMDEVVEAVRKLHGARDVTRSAEDSGPFSPVYRDDQLTGMQRTQIASAIDVLLSDTSPAEVAAATELPESEEAVVFRATGQITTAAARGVEVTRADLTALRPHVVNLNEGMLTEGGEYFTLPEDVERIFREDMEKAFADPVAFGMPSRAPNEPFRIMIWAHGGLISEKNGLAIATKHLKFWKANGIYPIYFVWETGLMQTLGQLLRSVGGAGAARNIFSDNISDPLIERALRLVGAEKIWSGMKRNSELGSTPQGGATKTATELKAFCDRHSTDVQLYAAGHSAGAIFHADFLPVAFGAGVPNVEQLHFLAPAIRVDAFKSRLMPHVGSRIKHLAVFTMVKDQELDDNCARVYRKSLLYLIRHSLERDEKAEILGLEESMRRDRDVARLLGLGGPVSATADVVFSPSVGDDGEHASRSITHGGFDDDAPTMNSIALRLLGLKTKRELKRAYQETSRALVDDPWTSSEVEELQRSFAAAFAGSGIPSSAPSAGGPLPVPSSSPAPTIVMPPRSGSRRALCIGIDRYPVRPLAGCVADARLWAKTLGVLGFDCTLMLDEEATYSSILAALEQLVKSSQRGDSIVWQYAGHGTQVPDVNGDEAGGDSPGQDEAICPIDLQAGHMVTDDEIGAIIQQLQPGVAFTMMMDCCHSGTLNRFGIGDPTGSGGNRDERARFLPLTEDLKQAYLQFAQSPKRSARSLTRSRSRDTLQDTSEILFTACLSTEVAFESNGQGEFTLRATRLLHERGDAISNEDFVNAIIGAFGSGRRQTPTITCAATLRGRQIFQSFDVGRSGSELESGRGSDTSATPFVRAADALEAAARELRQV